MTSSRERTYLYVNPLGEHKDISFNNIGKLKNSLETIDGRIEDSKIKNDSFRLQLTIWSITAGISIIGLLILIRGVNRNI